MRVRVFGSCVCLVCWIGVQACSSNDPVLGPGGNGNTDVEDKKDSGSPDPDDNPGQDESPGDGDGDGNPSSGADVCDGVDNDGDGVVDNLDVDGDGICDCLNIATIGTPREKGDSDFENWLDVRSGGVVALNDGTLTEEALAPFQVVIVQNVTKRKYAAEEIAALESWVKKGGGLFAMSGYGLADPNVNKLIAPYGLSFGLFLVLNTDYTKSLPVDRWNNHPISEGVQSIGVASAYPVGGAGTIFAEGEDALLGWQPIGRALTYGEGKVAVWGDEWISKNSEWANRSDYQVERFWQNLLSWLARENVCEVVIF